MVIYEVCNRGIVELTDGAFPSFTYSDARELTVINLPKSFKAYLHVNMKTILCKTKSSYYLSHDRKEVNIKSSISVSKAIKLALDKYYHNMSLTPVVSANYDRLFFVDDIYEYFQFLDNCLILHSYFISDIASTSNLLIEAYCREAKRVSYDTSKISISNIYDNWTTSVYRAEKAGYHIIGPRPYYICTINMKDHSIIPLQELTYMPPIICKKDRKHRVVHIFVILDDNGKKYYIDDEYRFTDLKYKFLDLTRIDDIARGVIVYGKN